MCVTGEWEIRDDLDPYVPHLHYLASSALRLGPLAPVPVNRRERCRLRPPGARGPFSRGAPPGSRTALNPSPRQLMLNARPGSGLPLRAQVLALRAWRPERRDDRHQPLELFRLGSHTAACATTAASTSRVRRSFRTRRTAQRSFCRDVCDCGAMFQMLVEEVSNPAAANSDSNSARCRRSGESCARLLW